MERSDEKSPVDDYGYTPLHLAVENRHVDVCDYIIKNLFDINPRYHDRDWYGNGPLAIEPMDQLIVFRQFFSHYL